jgi:hypothetical protein
MKPIEAKPGEEPKGSEINPERVCGPELQQMPGIPPRGPATQPICSTHPPTTGMLRVNRPDRLRSSSIRVDEVSCDRHHPI